MTYFAKYYYFIYFPFIFILLISDFNDIPLLMYNTYNLIIYNEIISNQNIMYNFCGIFI
jgi:hypothetical protein